MSKLNKFIRASIGISAVAHAINYISSTKVPTISGYLDDLYKTIAGPYCSVAKCNVKYPFTSQQSKYINTDFGRLHRQELYHEFEAKYNVGNILRLTGKADSVILHGNQINEVSFPDSRILNLVISKHEGIVVLPQYVSFLDVSNQDNTYQNVLGSKTGFIETIKTNGSIPRYLNTSTYHVDNMYKTVLNNVDKLRNGDRDSSYFYTHVVETPKGKLNVNVRSIVSSFPSGQHEWKTSYIQKHNLSKILTDLFAYQVIEDQLVPVHDLDIQRNYCSFYIDMVRTDIDESVLGKEIIRIDFHLSIDENQDII